MPPKKKPRGRLRQTEVFFPLAHRAIVANNVVQPGICPVLLIQNYPSFRSCHRHPAPIKSVEVEVSIVYVDNFIF